VVVELLVSAAMAYATTVDEKPASDFDKRRRRMNRLKSPVDAFETNDAMRWLDKVIQN